MTSGDASFSPRTASSLRLGHVEAEMDTETSTGLS